MLGNTDVHAVLAVKDTNSAKIFYEGTLGLKQVDENPGARFDLENPEYR